jgi:hypothetical protein
MNTPDIPRDRWGRPIVTPPNGGKPIGYTRATTLAGVLEDTYNLTQWKRRTVARGLAIRPDLVLHANSLGRQPEKATDEAGYKRWRAAMDRICDAAAEAAEASASATIGTALHTITERLDRGEDLGIIPDTYRPHITAYQEATKDLTAIHIERFTVCDELQAAGTPDRLSMLDGHSKMIVVDTKTGSLEFGLGKIAMQLAIYAHSQLYDPATGTRTPLDLDQERGLVVALNAVTAKCELVWVDLVAGWDAIQHAVWVRDWQKRKNLSQPYTGPAADLTVEAAVALEVAIRNATTTDELVQLWTAAGNVWNERFTELAAARKAELQQRRLTIVS